MPTDQRLERRLVPAGGVAAEQLGVGPIGVAPRPQPPDDLGGWEAGHRSVLVGVRRVLPGRGAIYSEFPVASRPGLTAEAGCRA